MNQKPLLILVLLPLTGMIWVFRNGNFTASKENYVELKVPEVGDYDFDIKPILSDRCYKCHGPDANKREAELQIDVEKAAFS